MRIMVKLTALLLSFQLISVDAFAWGWGQRRRTDRSSEQTQDSGSQTLTRSINPCARSGDCQLMAIYQPLKLYKVDNSSGAPVVTPLLKLPPHTIIAIPAAQDGALAPTNSERMINTTVNGTPTALVKGVRVYVMPPMMTYSLSMLPEFWSFPFFWGSTEESQVQRHVQTNVARWGTIDLFQNAMSLDIGKAVLEIGATFIGRNAAELAIELGTDPSGVSVRELELNFRTLNHPRLESMMYKLIKTSPQLAAHMVTESLVMGYESASTTSILTPTFRIDGRPVANAASATQSSETSAQLEPRRPSRVYRLGSTDSIRFSEVIRQILLNGRGQNYFSDEMNAMIDFHAPRESRELVDVGAEDQLRILRSIYHPINSNFQKSQLYIVRYKAEKIFKDGMRGSRRVRAVRGTGRWPTLSETDQAAVLSQERGAVRYCYRGVKHALVLSGYFDLDDYESVRTETMAEQAQEAQADATGQGESTTEADVDAPEFDASEFSGLLANQSVQGLSTTAQLALRDIPWWTARKGLEVENMLSIDSRLRSLRQDYPVQIVLQRRSETRSQANRRYALSQEFSSLMSLFNGPITLASAPAASNRITLPGLDMSNLDALRDYASPGSIAVYANPARALEVAFHGHIETIITIGKNQFQRPNDERDQMHFSQDEQSYRVVASDFVHRAPPNQWIANLSARPSKIRHAFAAYIVSSPARDFMNRFNNGTEELDRRFVENYEQMFNMGLVATVSDARPITQPPRRRAPARRSRGT